MVKKTANKEKGQPMAKKKTVEDAIPGKNRTVKLIEWTLRHAEDVHHGTQVGGILLKGDPGIGKTTFVELLGQVLGIKVVTVEVPHITEEHMINIPFIVFNPQTGAKQHMASQMVETKDETEQYKMVLAKSNLYTQLTTVQKIPDAVYLDEINHKAKPYITSIFRAMGGTETTIPKIIASARQNHKVILFLDEYYRQTTTAIRNILRDILNKKIGMHRIPDDVYIMFASNMKDTGIEEIHSNAQFSGIKFKPPKPNDWFDYLVSKYKQEVDVNLNPKVMAKFKQILKDDDINFTDPEAEVYTSPRRWEQLLVYINSSLPVKDGEQAAALLTNVKNKFINYRTGAYSSLHEKVVAAVAELIDETSNIKASTSGILTSQDWRLAMSHLILQQKRLGEHAKYVPIVSGSPGIGKTKEAWRIAQDHNLRLIEIDCSSLTPEDVIGIPLPSKKISEALIYEVAAKGRPSEDIAVQFSLPKLAQQIEQQCKEQDAIYVSYLKEMHGDNAQHYINEYKNQKYKYLIFFDELSRVASEKVLNALRRVILEKNFGPKGDGSGELLTLPKGSIVIGAMNPEGGGTVELTKHFADVIDVVPSDADWDSVKKYLMNEVPFKKSVSNTIKTVAMNIMEELINKFKSRDKQYNRRNAPFHLEISGADVYVSPREYQDMFATLVREINYGVDYVLEKQPDDFRQEIDDVVYEALEISVSFIFDKHPLVAEEEFDQVLKQWIRNLPDSIFSGVISKKVEGVTPLSQALDEYFTGKTKFTVMPDDVEIINANNSINHEEFITQVSEFLMEKIVDEETVKKYITDTNQDKIVVKGEALVTDPNDKVSILENFILSLLFTMKIHGYAFDRLGVLGKSLSVAASDITGKLHKSQKISDEEKQEVSIAIATLRSDIYDLIQDMA